MEAHADTSIARGLNKGRELLVNSEYSLAARTRLRRWALIEERVPDLADLRVLDLGGTGDWWARSLIRPRHVTAINLFEAHKQADSVTMIEGDVLQAAELVAGREFDLVFSNSLIEHLGGHSARREFAKLASTLAPRYVVQTPYRYFPLEPHWLFPAFQFLPFKARAHLAPRWPLGHTYGWDGPTASNEVMATELLSVTEMREYFPQSEIVLERVGGVPKSMIAIR